MQIPHVPEGVKEAPAMALRAVFAGIGQLLLIAERLTTSESGHEHADPAAAGRAAGAGEPEAAATAAGARAPAAGPGATELPGAPAALPVPNYDDLSLASLRGRLRSLDQAKLRVLASYERAHAGREAVVAMFERRIAKLETTKD